MTLPCTCVFVCKQCSSSFRTNVYGACSPLHFRLRCFPAYCRRTCFHVRKSVPLSQNRNRTYSTKYNILQRSLHLPCPPLLFPINLFPFLKQYAQVHIDQLNNNKQSKTDRRLPRTFDKMLPKTFSTPLTSGTSPPRSRRPASQLWTPSARWPCGCPVRPKGPRQTRSVRRRADCGAADARCVCCRRRRFFVH